MSIMKGMVEILEKDRRSRKQIERARKTARKRKRKQDSVEDWPVAASLEVSLPDFNAALQDQFFCHDCNSVGNKKLFDIREAIQLGFLDELPKNDREMLWQNADEFVGLQCVQCKHIFTLRSAKLSALLMQASAAGQWSKNSKITFYDSKLAIDP